MNDPDEPESGDELVTDYISGDEASLKFIDAMTPEERAAFDERIDAAFADPPRSSEPEKRPCPICTAFSHPHSPDCPRSGLSNGGNPYRALHARMSPPAAAWDEGFVCGLDWSSRRMSDALNKIADLSPEVPDEGVWPDQSAVHGVLLAQAKDAYAEGIADTLDKLRVRAAEVLPEVARFTLDEIEAILDLPTAASPDERLREA